ncbi:OLC1v1001047C1 [Oldenlandia corymbosa var. corymbosa]|uniref:OLC1v1001047C1 n=1 Tax=Oldenlandia corymbosa var. corymbosa TaxID=529605 RepID=A0AAV1D708_OLDCO|nr:OLC1v1001047C1 [Oldenlandia corymbosa var. corymbosa]
MTDKLTASKEHVNYAGLLVEMEIQEEVPEQVVFEDEIGIIQVQEVRYIRRPVKCRECQGFELETKICRRKKNPVQETPKPVPVKKTPDEKECRLVERPKSLTRSRGNDDLNANQRKEIANKGPATSHLSFEVLNSLADDENSERERQKKP